MTTLLAPGEASFALSDLDLVHACKNGDIGAFEQLVERYDRKLLRVAQSITRNREDSQDVVQEVFLKVFQHIARFREDCQFSTWLIRITLNQSLMRLRKQRRVREESLDDDFQSNESLLPTEVIDWDANPEQLYWASELREILTKTLEGLRPLMQRVFVLRDIEGLTIDQTAQVLNLSPAAVKARLWRVRMQLREGLNRNFRKRPESERALFIPSGGPKARRACISAYCPSQPSQRHERGILMDANRLS